jgi:hypothetical protein
VRFSAHAHYAGRARIRGRLAHGFARARGMLGGLAALVLLSLLTDSSKRLLDRAAGMPVSVRSRRVRASMLTASALAPAAAASASLPAVLQISGS